MLGIYDYTVVLTYLSLLSAGSGIVTALSGGGHPYIGVFFLLFCGLLDTFDGKVARTKKNRSSFEKNFGIQIDSLSDLVAFGVLPACIGAAVIRTSPFINSLIYREDMRLIHHVIKIALFAVLILYMLAALIRLAYFNVTEQERQLVETGARKTYKGLAVTSSSLILPTILLAQYIVREACHVDISIIFFITIVIIGFLFVANIDLPKPGKRGITIMVTSGIIECIVFIICKFVLFKG